MLKTIGSRATVRLAFLVIAGTSGGWSALAQSVPSFADHLLDRVAVPLPVAYHARTGRLFVGMQAGRTTVALTDGTEGADVEIIGASAGNKILRLRVDPRHERLWVLEVGVVHVIDLPTGRRVATVELRNWFYTADATNCLPDLQLDATGTAFVSDSVQSKLWRIDANDFALREHSLTPTTQQWVDAGFSALVLQDDGSIVAAAGAPGTLWHIDRQLSNAEPIALDTPLHGACAMERSDTSENEVFVLAAGREVFTVYRFALARVPYRAHAVIVERVSSSNLVGLTTIDRAPYLAIAGDAAAATRPHASGAGIRFVLSRPGNVSRAAPRPVEVLQ
jgi:hypothetical protein